MPLIWKYTGFELLLKSFQDIIIEAVLQINVK